MVPQLKDSCGFHRPVTMIRMHAAPSPASSPAEKWPNDEKAETRALGADNEKAPNRRPGLSRIPDRPRSHMASHAVRSPTAKMCEPGNAAAAYREGYKLVSLLSA
jgi:hypothetical protein